jgi:hypothetical protein
MKIVIKRNEEQPEVTFDLKDVNNLYVIRDTIKLALEVDGFTIEAIAEVFNQMPDVKCEPE